MACPARIDISDGAMLACRSFIMKYHCTLSPLRRTNRPYKGSSTSLVTHNHSHNPHLNHHHKKHSSLMDNVFLLLTLVILHMYTTTLAPSFTLAIHSSIISSFLRKTQWYHSLVLLFPSAPRKCTQTPPSTCRSRGSGIDIHSCGKGH